MKSAVSNETGFLRAKSNIAQRPSQRMKQAGMGRKGKDNKEPHVKSQMSRKPFQSTRLKEEIYKPWLEQKNPAQRSARWITIASIIIGIAITGVCTSHFWRHLRLMTDISSMLGRICFCSKSR
jgi:hypothetical protein